MASIADFNNVFSHDKIKSRIAWLSGFLIAFLAIFYFHQNSHNQGPEYSIASSSQDEPLANSVSYIAPPVSIPRNIILPRFNPFDKKEPDLETTLTLQPRQNFANMLRSYGLPKSDVYEISKIVGKTTSLSQLRVGTKFNVALEKNDLYDITTPNDVEYKVSSIEFKSSAGVTTQITRVGDSFKTKAIYSKIKMSPLYKSGEISGSLYQSAARAGIPVKMVQKSIKRFSYDVDFRSLKKGDKFAYAYDTYKDENGDIVGYSHLRYAALTVKGKKHEIFFVTGSDGKGEWYNERGLKSKPLLMRTPIDGARISSRYGKRRHPVLGYTKMHRGIDFAAPTGTPIYAAGDGVVLKKYYSSTYGNYISIRHTGTYTTAYAHLSRFRSGLRKGSSVKQGQVIGYVGSTGRSTGPHLHYEVIKNGVQINPLSGSLPTRKPGPHPHKAQYEKLKKDITNRQKGILKAREYSSVKEIQNQLI